MAAASLHIPSQPAFHQPDPLGLIGDHELPPDLLPELVAYVEERRDRNLDTYIACTGREGWGKSSLALTMALELEPDLPAQDVILDKKDYYRVYNPDQTEGTYVFDEANRLLFNRRWNDRHQVALIQEVIENRQNKNVTFLVLPQFKTLDKYAREGRIDLWFACTSQGIAMIRKLSYNSYTEEAYYPIVVDEHRWEPLEVTYPAFAETYYSRKANAHSSAFKRRQAKNREKDLEEETDQDFKDARKKAILSTKD